MFHFVPGDISGLVCLTLMSVFLRLAFAWHMFPHSEPTCVLVFQTVLLQTHKCFAQYESPQC